MAPKKNSDFIIEQSAYKINFTYWRIKNIIIVFLVIFVALSFLGFTGPGLLTKVHEKTFNKLFAVQYDRFGRRGLSSEIRFSVSNPTGTNIALRFPKDFFHNFLIDTIMPTPIRSELDDGEIIYHFAATGLDNEIIFQIQPITIGSHNLLVKWGTQSIELKQFSYP